MNYGSLWRSHRRLMHRFFSVSVADIFDDKIHQAVGVFLRRLLESPERCVNHASLYVSPSLDHCTVLGSPRAFYWEALPDI